MYENRYASVAQTIANWAEDDAYSVDCCRVCLWAILCRELEPQREPHVTRHGYYAMLDVYVTNTSLISLHCLVLWIKANTTILKVFNTTMNSHLMKPDLVVQWFRSNLQRWPGLNSSICSCEYRYGFKRECCLVVIQDTSNCWHKTTHCPPRATAGDGCTVDGLPTTTHMPTWACMYRPVERGRCVLPI